MQFGGSAQHRYDSDTEACELFIGQLNWYINLNFVECFCMYIDSTGTFMNTGAFLSTGSEKVIEFWLDIVT